MALNRIIETKDKSIANLNSISEILKTYLGDSGTTHTDMIAEVDVPNKARKIADLSNVFILADLKSNYSDMDKQLGSGGKRTFQIFISDDNVSIVTNIADSYTKAVADGFAQVVSRMAGSSIKFI